MPYKNFDKQQSPTNFCKKLALLSLVILIGFASGGAVASGRADDCKIEEDRVCPAGDEFPVPITWGAFKVFCSEGDQRYIIFLDNPAYSGENNAADVRTTFAERVCGQPRVDHYLGLTNGNSVPVTVNPISDGNGNYRYSCPNTEEESSISISGLAYRAARVRIQKICHDRNSHSANTTAEPLTTEEFRNAVNQDPVTIEGVEEEVAQDPLALANIIQRRLDARKTELSQLEQALIETESRLSPESDLTEDQRNELNQARVRVQEAREQVAEAEGVIGGYIKELRDFDNPPTENRMQTIRESAVRYDEQAQVLVVDANNLLERGGRVIAGDDDPPVKSDLEVNHQAPNIEEDNDSSACSEHQQDSQEYQECIDELAENCTNYAAGSDEHRNCLALQRFDPEQIQALVDAAENNDDQAVEGSGDYCGLSANQAMMLELMELVNLNSKSSFRIRSGGVKTPRKAEEMTFNPNMMLSEDGRSLCATIWGGADNFYPPEGLSSHNLYPQYDFIEMYLNSYEAFACDDVRGEFQRKCSFITGVSRNSDDVDVDLEEQFFSIVEGQEPDTEINQQVADCLRITYGQGQTSISEQRRDELFVLLQEGSLRDDLDNLAECRAVAMSSVVRRAKYCKAIQAAAAFNDFETGEDSFSSPNGISCRKRNELTADFRACRATAEVMIGVDLAEMAADTSHQVHAGVVATNQSQMVAQSDSQQKDSLKAMEKVSEVNQGHETFKSIFQGAKGLGLFIALDRYPRPSNIASKCAGKLQDEGFVSCCSLAAEVYRDQMFLNGEIRQYIAVETVKAVGKSVIHGILASEYNKQQTRLRDARRTVDELSDTEGRRGYGFVNNQGQGLECDPSNPDCVAGRGARGQRTSHGGAGGISLSGENTGNQHFEFGGGGAKVADGYDYERPELSDQQRDELEAALRGPASGGSNDIVDAGRAARLGRGGGGGGAGGGAPMGGAGMGGMGMGMGGMGMGPGMGGGQRQPAAVDRDGGDDDEGPKNIRTGSKNTYKGGKGFSFSGSKGKGKKDKKDNPLSNLFNKNKKGQDKGGVKVDAATAKKSIGGAKGTGLFEKISKRYRVVNKESRLLEYEEVE